MTEAFKGDKNPQKINLGIGAYRDENGKPYVLNAVNQAEAFLYNTDPDRECLLITRSYVVDVCWCTTTNVNYIRTFISTKM